MVMIYLLHKVILKRNYNLPIKIIVQMFQFIQNVIYKLLKVIFPVIPIYTKKKNLEDFILVFDNCTFNFIMRFYIIF